MNIASKLKEVEKRITKLEERSKPVEQAIFHFKRDANRVETYNKLGTGEDAVWVDKQTLDEHISQYKREGVIIFVPERLEQK